MLKIEYKDIKPSFGKAIIKSDGSKVIEIDASLSKSIQAFILKHEEYHLSDKAVNWVWREIKANLYGAYYEPWGFIRCLFKSLAWYRIMFYIERFRTKS